jgi:hypothetical protein
MTAAPMIVTNQRADCRPEIEQSTSSALKPTKGPRPEGHFHQITLLPFWSRMTGNGAVTKRRAGVSIYLMGIERMAVAGSVPALVWMITSCRRIESTV